MPPKKATKGKKEILEGNRASLHFYGTMIATANAIYFLVRMLWMYDSFTIWHWLGLGILLASYGLSYQLLSSAAKTTYSESGVLLDVGIDLNLEGGMPEYFKDLIILTTAVQVMSIFSDYFWLLLVAAPAYAAYLLWGSLIQPWLTAGSESTEVDEKTKKKMVKKERRMQRTPLLWASEQSNSNR